MNIERGVLKKSDKSGFGVRNRGSVRVNMDRVIISVRVTVRVRVNCIELLLG